MHKQMPGNFKEVKRCCKEAFLLLLKVILEAIKSWDVIGFSTYCLCILAELLLKKGGENDCVFY